MKRLEALKSIFLCGAAALLAGSAAAHGFDIPAGDLKSALDAYVRQAGVELVVSSSAIKGVKTRGVKGDVAPDEALTRILKARASTSIASLPARSASRSRNPPSRKFRCSSPSSAPATPPSKPSP